MFPDKWILFACRSAADRRTSYERQRGAARSECECCPEPAVQVHRRQCLQQLAALSAAALVAPAHAAIVDEDAARRVFDSAGQLTLSLHMLSCCNSA